MSLVLISPMPLASVLTEPSIPDPSALRQILNSAPESDCPLLPSTFNTLIPYSFSLVNVMVKPCKLFAEDILNSL
jgi:hypothetical protein